MTSPTPGAKLDKAYAIMKLNRADAYRRLETFGGTRGPLDRLILASAALVPGAAL